MVLNAYYYTDNVISEFRLLLYQRQLLRCDSWEVYFHKSFESSFRLTQTPVKCVKSGTQVDYLSVGTGSLDKSYTNLNN